jgi:hypothetical protein
MWHGEYGGFRSPATAAAAIVAVSGVVETESMRKNCNGHGPGTDGDTGALRHQSGRPVDEIVRVGLQSRAFGFKLRLGR